jgi:hypothetical protein
MLHLHVRLHVIHNVLSLLVHHLCLTMLSVGHHGHLAWVTDLRSIALVRTAWVRGVGGRSMLLRLLMRSLSGHSLVVHGSAHMSLVVGWMRRGMRSWCTISRHGHWLRCNQTWGFQWIRHSSRIALHSIWAGVGHARRFDGVNRGILHWHGNGVMLWVR